MILLYLSSLQGHRVNSILNHLSYTYHTGITGRRWDLATNYYGTFQRKKKKITCGIGIAKHEKLQTCYQKINQKKIKSFNNIRYVCIYILKAIL